MIEFLKTPIWIPSKGRSLTIRTQEHFQGCRDLLNIVVEPQDAQAYQIHNSIAKVHVLPENNKGISYVRNWILEENKSCGPFWMMDDDISGFMDYSVIGVKIKVTGTQAIIKANSIFKNSGYMLAQGALEYDQFAWSQKKPLSLAGYCDVAVWMNPEHIRSLRYRTDLPGKEDRSFTLSLLVKGLMTAKASQIGFRCPSNGSNKGGLSETYYATGKDTEAAHSLAKAFPLYAKVITKPNGRVDAKINWSSFKPKKIK